MKYLLLSALALSLAACGAQPAPTEIQVYTTATYTYTVGARVSTVSVNAGKVGTKFCYTDSTLSGTLVCNNLTTGSRTVQTGYDLSPIFTEPDAPTTPALTRP